MHLPTTWAAPFRPLAIFLSLGIICGFMAASALAAPTDQPALTLGKVKILGSATCPAGAAKGATCQSISVSCPAIPDLKATMATTLPAATPLGTIVMHDSSGGTGMFNHGFADDYVADGYRAVQIAWASDWELTGGVGLKAAACRPATFYQFVFTNVHHSSRTTGFCGQGHSAGSATMAFAVAHYGLAGIFDYILLSGGPAVSRMDYGCDPSLYTGPPRDLCSLDTTARYNYGNGSKMNQWENTTTCAKPNPPQTDINKWASDSVVSSGATYAYSQTGMSWYFCVTPPVNESGGQATFFIDDVMPKNNPPDVSCYSGVCTGELVWQDPAAFSAMHSEMLSQCVANH
jgi:hypothetical protein